MNDYVQKPAKIQKIKGKTYVSMTLKNPTWWKYFKVKQGNKYVSAKVIKKGKKTSVVRFPVTSSGLKNGVYVKTHIVVKSIDYNNKYTSKIVFK